MATEVSVNYDESGNVLVATATATAPSNIAVVKYWGKRCTTNNLPINSSLSVTLDRRHLATVTTVAASRSFKCDRLWLNGVEEHNIADNKRVARVLAEIRMRACNLEDPATGKIAISQEDWPQYRLHVVSENSFPTAAGLASSASGYACLVRALAALYRVQDTYPNELTTIARMGSGSACRSLYGGFVKWEMGSAANGSDSVGVQVAPLAHWPELEAVICVVSDNKKGTSSTSGMSTSVRTSALLAHRAAAVVPSRMKEMETAVLAKDFLKFAELTMRDSNQFHATCLDTFPPIFYMNDTSKSVVALVHKMNSEAGETRYAYTFDAGPNAVVFCLREHANVFLDRVLERYVPDKASAPDDFEFLRGKACASAREIRARFSPDADAVMGGIRYVYHTQVGPGAEVLPPTGEACLVDEAGMPK